MNELPTRGDLTDDEIADIHATARTLAEIGDPVTDDDIDDALASMGVDTNAHLTLLIRCLLALGLTLVE